ncbi:MAG: LysR substrate-binding domain-containing protein [Alphaproteobacteria bacterium]
MAARARPGIDLRLDASLEPPDFARDRVDMAAHYGDGAYPGLESTRLFADEVFPVCSPDLLHGPNLLRHPADLRHHTLLHLEWHPRYGEWPDWAMWLRAAGANEVDAAPGPRFTEQTMSLPAAEEGQGVALGSAVLVADDMARGRLVQPFALHLTTKLAVYLVYPKDRVPEPKVAAFRDWLTKEAAQSQTGARER